MEKKPNTKKNTRTPKIENYPIRDFKQNKHNKNRPETNKSHK